MGTFGLENSRGELGCLAGGRIRQALGNVNLQPSMNAPRHCKCPARKRLHYVIFQLCQSDSYSSQRTLHPFNNLQSATKALAVLFNRSVPPRAIGS